MKNRERQLNVALVAILGLTAVSVWLTLRANDGWRDARAIAQRHESVLRGAQSVLVELQDAETSQRGYFLTGRESYLEPYRSARRSLAETLAALAKAMPENAGGADRYARLDALINAKVIEIDRTIARFAAGDRDGALQTVMTDVGKLVMDDIRKLIREIEESNDTPLKAAQAQAERQELVLRASAIATAVLSSILALVLIVVLVRRNRQLHDDLDERLRTLETLREAQQRNQAVFDHSGDLLFIVDCADPEDCLYETVNAEVEKLYGRPLAEIRGKHHREIMGEEGGRFVQTQFTKCVRSGGPVRYDSVAHGRAFDVVLMPLRDAEGKVTRILGSARDVTERKRLEEALRQTQKLEAIGQLTGGVAHDFNNLLQVILGNLEMLLPKLGDAALVQRVQNAILAAERGQGMTRQLLAFARQQPLERRTLAVSRVLQALEPMVRSSLGERIEFEIDVAPDVWRVRVDPVQLDSALLNLVVNARDAMSGGGRIRIEARNLRVDPDLSPRGDLPGGEYVSIAVADTGGGIRPEILEKVFQPFFTTKPVGRGTGLGLSMVYGFARQSGGGVDIDSTVGRGTTVTVLLPRAPADAGEGDSVAPEPPSGSEAILVVEDDEAVRSTVVELMRTLGYVVSHAHDAESALAMLEDGHDVHLLLVDVVMPGTINGVELARRARALRPGLRVLLASGYADDPALREPAVGQDFPLIEKPYRRDEIGVRIRSLLDAPAAVPVATPAAGRANILVVEDEPLVRMLAVDALIEAGLGPLEAATGAEALALAERDDVAVAIVDLGLPDIAGAALLAALRARRPALPLIVVSGDTSAVPEVPGPRVETLRKPYTAAALVRAVRDALGS